MPRKAAAAADGETAAAPGGEPRRSSRIKDLPKVEAPVKKTPKPRAKKEPKEGDEDKPKRGRKRKDTTETNGDATAPEDDAEAPPAKKAKPASKAAPGSKPPSKAAAAKPASKASAKPASKASVKPASRAGSKKPASKAEAAPVSSAPVVGETIAEETEAEAAEAEAAAVRPSLSFPPSLPSSLPFPAPPPFPAACLIPLPGPVVCPGRMEGPRTRTAALPLLSLIPIPYLSSTRLPILSSPPAAAPPPTPTRPILHVRRPGLALLRLEFIYSFLVCAVVVMIAIYVWLDSTSLVSPLRLPRSSPGLQSELWYCSSLMSATQMPSRSSSSSSSSFSPHPSVHVRPRPSVATGVDVARPIWTSVGAAWLAPVYFTTPGPTCTGC
ncbi:hypothetical protein FB451DRAFT_1166800 [Mycena latifolia]|nr:hypothetical protein FB451DRAFT_1166800 [Mycena latifolia]